MARPYLLLSVMAGLEPAIFFVLRPRSASRVASELPAAQHAAY
jgi:hypothetical protein